MYKIQIKDLTTGETIWQAPHDELYETNNPWPSATLRNFDDVTAAWYDAVAVGYAAIGDHDCEFEISYKNNVDYPGTIFYSNSQAGSINLHQVENNKNTFSSFRAFNETYPSLIIPLDAGVQNSGSHIVKFKRQNGTAEAWVDGVLVKSVTSKLGNKPLYADNVPASHFDGNIFYIRLTDLTTGRTVWSYPSEAERVRLLTKTNVRTDRGVFEAADETKSAAISTQLTDTPQTFLVFDDNGQMINSATMPGGVFTIPAGTKIRALLGFDRALTAAEIAAFGVRRPRNFAEKTMTWTDAKTALDTIDQSHDFTFEIEFKCVKTNAAYVFASDGSKDFIRVFMSNGTVIVNTALLGTSSGGSTQFSAGSDSTNRHVLTVKFTGNAITASVDSEVVYTRENLFRNVIEIGTPRSNAGYVHKISVTDDTTGETVWRANHNDLFTY